MDAKASLYQSILKGNINFYQSIGLPVKEYSWGAVGKTGMQTPLLNGVILVENGDQAAKDVNDVETYFRRDDLPYSWWIEKSRVTPQLKETLEKKGMQSAGIFPGMGIELAQNLKDPSHEVIDVTDLEKWMEVIAEAFQFNEEVAAGYSELLETAKNSPYYHMGVKVEGKMVATGSVLCLENCAYIYNVATLEEYRGKGYATSVTAKLLLKAKEQGNDSAVLVSSPMAVSVYRQLGFESLTDFEIFL